MFILTINEISKSYGSGKRSVEALRQISFSVQEGEFVTLIGPSGSGKSTLFRILAGLEQPDSGQILYNGEEIEKKNGRFGYMPQRDALFPWRTVMQNVLLSPELDGRDLVAARQSAEKLLPLFGLENFGDAWPATLSGGMQQRAALLRTFMTDRDILLMDEPFGALDAITRHELQQWLLEVHQQFNKTILFITHDVEEAIMLGDRVIVLTARPGRIAADIAITLPKPRPEAIQATTDFAQYKQKAMRLLKGR